jgi:hypothetical protein
MIFRALVFCHLNAAEDAAAEEVNIDSDAAALMQVN